MNLLIIPPAKASLGPSVAEHKARDVVREQQKGASHQRNTS